jgi:dihydroxyacetone kinase
MTYLVNDPSEFSGEAVRGLAALDPGLAEVHGGVVRSTETPENQPAWVIGGGSGHYPAFAGWVGPGMGHGAACGNIFSSPAASQIYSVARNADNGGGVIFGFGNYAGDVLHFGAAAERLRQEGIDARTIKISDDIMSESRENHRDRRGIAGDLPVVKITGAAIEAGVDLDEAERIAWKANDATSSFGVAFDGCTLPGSDEPLFHVEPGQMSVGLGIHGEPGVRDKPIASANEIAQMLVDGVFAEEPERGTNGYNGRIVMILNGLGTVKYEELFIAYGRLAKLLADKNVVAVRPEVGEFVTSLDMAGLSLTVVFLDEELEKYWLAPAKTPAYSRGVMPDVERVERTHFWNPENVEIPEANQDSRELASCIRGVLDRFETVCKQQEAELGRIDSVAGDGDHGQGMVYGSHGAAKAAGEAVDRSAGARTLLVHAGDAWAEAAGGTSGALWGAALTAAGGVFSDNEGSDDARILQALRAGVDAVERLGGAQVGQKTIMDAAVPFRDGLDESGGDVAATVTHAAAMAMEAAEATADLTAQKGRARVLGEKSRGTPDPGAMSFALLMQSLGEQLENRGES